MARPFEVVTEVSADVKAILHAFADRRYWLDRLAAFGGDSMALDSLQVGPDGDVVVRTTQDVRGDMLPSGIARMLPGETKILRTESWQPPDGGAVRGEFAITARGVPSSGSGTMVLAPVPAGSRLEVRGCLEVRIPMVGGRIERYVAELIARDIPQVQQFTARWIGGADHDGR